MDPEVQAAAAQLLNDQYVAKAMSLIKQVHAQLEHTLQLDVDYSDADARTQEEMQIAHEDVHHNFYHELCKRVLNEL